MAKENKKGHSISKKDEIKVRNIQKEISRCIENATLLLKKPLKEGRDFIIDVPKEPKSFRLYEKETKSALKGAVYVFYLGENSSLTKEENRFFKIGRVGPKSTARFDSQHYNPKSNGSNLAKSLLIDKDRLGLKENGGIGDFIRNNFVRINILFLGSAPEFSNELVEAMLHYKYKPFFEGPKSQRGRGLSSPSKFNLGRKKISTKKRTGDKL